MTEHFTPASIPDQSGRVAVVTGANSGLGLVTARELAAHGAQVIIACRDTEKGRSAAASIAAAHPDAHTEVRELDLADLGSVRSFAEALAGEHERIDLLVNNAGIMAPPRRTTKDGFELQFGTNHLGHFALTARLLDRLLAAERPRVVTLSSGAHRIGRINFDDLQGERRYLRWLAYGQSKLADLIFAIELARRSAAADSELISVAAHPGYAATNLQTTGPPKLEGQVMSVLNRVVAQSAEMGALPTLYAATMPDVSGGLFFGPSGPGEMRGHPKVVTGAGRAYDEETGRRLWAVSEELTGVSFAFPTAALTP